MTVALASSASAAPVRPPGGLSSGAPPGAPPESSAFAELLRGQTARTAPAEGHSETGFGPVHSTPRDRSLRDNPDTGAAQLAAQASATAHEHPAADRAEAAKPRSNGEAVARSDGEQGDSAASSATGVDGTVAGRTGTADLKASALTGDPAGRSTAPGGTAAGALHAAPGTQQAEAPAAAGVAAGASGVRVEADGLSTTAASSTATEGREQQLGSASATDEPTDSTNGESRTASRTAAGSSAGSDRSGGGASVAGGSAEVSGASDVAGGGAAGGAATAAGLSSTPTPSSAAGGTLTASGAGEGTGKAVPATGVHESNAAGDGSGHSGSSGHGSADVDRQSVFDLVARSGQDSSSAAHGGGPGRGSDLRAIDARGAAVGSVSDAAAAPQVDSTAAAAAAVPSPSLAPAAAAGEAVATTAGTQMQDVIEALHATMLLASKQGGAQARIALQPAEMGGVRIHLSQTEQGLIARVTADTAAGASALNAGRAELHHSLSTLGVSLLRLDIGSSADPRSGGQAEREVTAQAAAGRVPGASGNANDSPEEQPATAVPGTQRIASGALVDVLA